jgi:hypothetical protein
MDILIWSTVSFTVTWDTPHTETQQIWAHTVEGLQETFKTFLIKIINQLDIQVPRQEVVSDSLTVCGGWETGHRVSAMARLSSQLCLNQSTAMAGRSVCEGCVLGGVLLGSVAHEPTGNIRSPFSAHTAEFYLHGEVILMICMFHYFPITFFISHLIGKEIDKAYKRWTCRLYKWIQKSDHPFVKPNHYLQFM